MINKKEMESIFRNNKTTALHYNMMCMINFRNILGPMYDW